MFNLFKPKKKIPEPEHKELIHGLETMFYDIKLSEAFYNSESKITLINTYSENISDLVDKAYSDTLGSRVNAVNLYNYLYRTDVNRLKVMLSKLIELCNTSKINNHVKSDIQELTDVYELLKAKE